MAKINKLSYLNILDYALISSVVLGANFLCDIVVSPTIDDIKTKINTRRINRKIARRKRNNVG